MRALRVGDVCLTVNTKHSALNNGLLVVVRFIHPGRLNRDIYLIQRVDGQRIPSSLTSEGVQRFYSDLRVWSVRSKLRALDEQTEHEPAQLVEQAPA